ncbi:MAG TPA: hypothetical protein VF503_13440 [Sphingobium sp.]|uniref:hypothetical protein n=1 Tax=Sphingobium sp. TaxID=1912891 RepID=UPI002ED46993
MGFNHQDRQISTIESDVTAMPILKSSIKPLQGLAVIAILALPLMYFCMFTDIAHFDDEGTLLIGFRSLLDGRRMYDEIYSLYGPFYNLVYGFFYGSAGIPLTHTGGRTIALGMWIFFCSGFALLSYRLTRSMAAMVFTYLIMVLVSQNLVHSPGHPEEISLVLVTLVLLCCSALDRRANPWIIAALGAAIACLALIKINFGVYVGGAVAFTLLATTRPTWWSRIAASLLLCALLLLPIAVESLLIKFDWAQYSIVSSTLTIAAALIMVRSGSLPARLSERHWIILCASFLLACTVILSLMLQQGSSAFAILNSVILQNVSFIQNWYIPSPVGLEGAIASLLSLILCLLSRYPVEGAQRTQSRNRIFGACKGIFGILSILYVPDPVYIITYLTPFCWLGLVSTGGQVRPSIGRNALCVFAAIMSLYPFPVAGHQVDIAAMPTLLIAIVMLHDMIARDLPPWLASVSARIAISARIAGGVVLVALLAFFTIRGAQAYAAIEPLDLPGTTHIRIPADRLTDIRWANAALKSCDSSFSLPGQFSYALWTGHRLVTDLNVNDQLAFLTWPQQQQIISALSRERNVCILYNPTLLAFFDRGQIQANPPLLRYILANSVEESRRGDMIILRLRHP